MMFALNLRILPQLMIKKQATPPSQPTLVTDWEKMFEGKKFADFTFKVDGEEIQVHKAILAGKEEFL
jgi:hypothetical protein